MVKTIPKNQQKYKEVAIIFNDEASASGFRYERFKHLTSMPKVKVCEDVDNNLHLFGIGKKKVGLLDFDKCIWCGKPVRSPFVEFCSANCAHKNKNKK